MFIADVEIVLALFAAVAVLALAARAIDVHYSIVLVVAGAALGWIPGLPRLELPPNIFLYFMLPPLIYPAAIRMPWSEFRANLRSISLLALGLVLFTMTGLAWITHAAFGLPLASAFVLGAIVSPTDPIAALAMTERMSAPRRIQRILEGESLVNDSTGLIGYRISVAAVAAGTFAFGNAVVEFLKMTGGGIAIGLGAGWIIAQIQRRIDDPPIETTISLLTPFGAYIAAERTGVSGVLAVVTTGLFLGWRMPVIHEAQTRLRAVPFWEILEFLLTGLVFLLVGLELPHIIAGIEGASPWTLAWQALLVSASVIVIRAVWVFPAAYLPHLLSARIRERDPFPDWEHVALVAWTGTRGAVSLAAALALPAMTRSGAPFTARNNIQYLTYSVIVTTLVLQGLSLPSVIRRLNIQPGYDPEEEERQARIEASRAVLDHLESLESETPEGPLERLRAEYSQQISDLEAQAQPRDHERSRDAAAYGQLRRKAFEIEREALLDIDRRGGVSPDVLRRLQHELDIAEAQLRKFGSSE